MPAYEDIFDKLRANPRKEEKPKRETTKAVLFPMCSKECEECGKQVNNNSTDYKTIGYFHEINDQEARWFCSMTCIMTHKTKENGMDLLKDLAHLDT